MGELFEQLYERDCPQCGNRLLVVSFPTPDEIRTAAGLGNEKAASMFQQVERQEERQTRWEAEHLARTEQLPNLDAPSVTARIVIGPAPDDASSDSHLELWLNNQLVHREPGFYETLEPLKRIVPLLRSKYGMRLESIDTSGANLYLYGDRLGSIAEGKQILSESGFGAGGRQSD
jgi:hypothetical protein